MLVTGSGPAAAMATAIWLSHRLRELGLATGAGLHAPALVVANFGTAGAYPGTWEIGETVLANRIREGRGESLYPERLVRWSGPEGECRSVPAPQRERWPDDEGQPLFDMEAFAVAEVTATYLSLAHCVTGKCVSDHIGEPLDWKSLASRCQAAYHEGALRFLRHARDHLAALETDSRRQRSLELTEQVATLLEQARQALPLTVTQERELARHLRARLAELPTPATSRSWIEAFRARLQGLQVGDKRQAKAALASLLAVTDA